MISLKKARIYTTEDPSQNNDINISDGEIPKNNFNCQTDLTSLMITSMEQELLRLRQENYEMKTSLESFSFCENSFSTSDERVRFYTGLPSYIILITLYNFIGAHVTVSSRNSLTKFQQFIMVLMRLRLNLSVQDLAYRFHISKSTVSRTFLQWIDILYTRMKPLIIWPERDALRKTMPLEFRKYFGQKVAVIIDCFEVFVDRPSNLEARAQTFSSYKHHNTVKFLIGITPQGVISFLSKGWGGRVSDKHLTEHSGFLNRLSPGDMILADRGFDISDSVGLHCAQVSIPAFTKGKKQLSALDVEKTRKIANVRIHVERVIGCVRQKYTILGATLPIDYLQCTVNESVSTIDKIATVCCALTNLTDSVIPFD